MHASIPEGIATQDEQRLAWPTATAALGGGCLFAVFYVAHLARVLGIVGGQPGPIWPGLFLVETIGLLLLVLSVPGWCTPFASASPVSLVGAVLLSLGLLIWALAAASNFAPDGQLPIPLPTWLYSGLVAIGTPIFAATSLRSQGAPVAAVFVVGLCGPLGMLLLAGPDWAYAIGGLEIEPISPAPGQLALALYALGWSWAGLANRRQSASIRFYPRGN
jgi:hypothetical protein